MREEISVVFDVGCANWYYAQALADFFPRAKLVAVEVDGGRRYWNLYRRIDYAQAAAFELTRGREIEAQAVWEDFSDVSIEQYYEKGSPGRVAVCFFFPFVSPDPCKAWGLPTRFVKFEELLSRAGQAPLIVSAHQGEWEAQIARCSYKKVRPTFCETVLQPSEFSEHWPSLHPVHIFTSL